MIIKHVESGLRLTFMYYTYTAQTGLPYFDRAAVIVIEVLQKVSEKKLSFGLKKIILFIGVIHFSSEITTNKGGPRNPSAPIDVNVFRTTNFRSRFAMRCAEFHGNTLRDSQPAYSV